MPAANSGNHTDTAATSRLATRECMPCTNQTSYQHLGWPSLRRDEGEKYQGRKDMVYLTTHSIHFIYDYMEGRKDKFYLTTHSIHFI